MTAEAVEVLKLALHGTTLGYLTGYQSGRTNLVFDPHYIDQTERPTFTLTGRGARNEGSSTLCWPSPPATSSVKSPAASAIGTRPDGLRSA